MLTIKKLFGFGTPKKYTQIDLQQFDEMRKKPNTIVLDVRTPAEARDKAVPGSKLINIMSSDFRKKLEQLDKSKTYLVYCRSGNRSGKACKIMSQLGFESLYNLKTGIMGWTGK